MAAPTRYVMMDPPPPPHHRRDPRYENHGNDPGRCVRCFCCCYFCCFILFLLINGVCALFLFFFHPQVPTYSIETFNVEKFDIQNENKLYTELKFTLQTKNTNKDIAFIYEKNSAVNLTYSGELICNGSVPSFKQPAHNTSMVSVELKGQTNFDSKMQERLKKDQKEKRIPLAVKVKVPVIIVIDGNSLKEIYFVIECQLKVDNLQPGQRINILSTDYRIRAEK